jgi:hypothetical protein
MSTLSIRSRGSRWLLAGLVAIVIGCGAMALLGASSDGDDGRILLIDR